MVSIRRTLKTYPVDLDTYIKYRRFGILHGQKYVIVTNNVIRKASYDKKTKKSTA